MILKSSSLVQCLDRSGKWCPVSTHLQQVFGGLGRVIKHGGVAVGLLLPILGPTLNNLDWFLGNFERKPGKSAKNKYRIKWIKYKCIN